LGFLIKKILFYLEIKMCYAFDRSPHSHPHSIMSNNNPSTNTCDTPDNALKSSPVSLAKAEDFNRWPGEWPEGVPKAFFPWVYPKYAQPESPESRNSNSNSVTGQSWYSSPIQSDRTGELHLFNIVLGLNLLQVKRNSSL
jgi:hypothetical protein